MSFSIDATGFRSWFYVKKLDVCVCVPAKCGITTLANAVWSCPDSGPLRRLAYVSNFGPYSPAAVMGRYPDTPKYLAVREPVSRFASLWRDKARDGRLASIAGKSPEELIAHIRAFPLGDGHWYPQYGFVVPDARLIPYDKLLERLGVEHVPRNKSRHLPDDPPMPTKELKKHYALDFELWARREK